ncbi:MAG TPA: signal recognition particle-docking protein FtsY [Bacteroidota bacterium]|nr:signal recognition particle-docking protein FtsY [Bacteroidota bacterium]
MGLLDNIRKLRETLGRTRDDIASKVARLALLRRTIDEETLEGLEEILLAADVGTSTSAVVIDAIRMKAKEQGAPDSSALLALLKEEITRQFGGNGSAGPSDPFARPAARPWVIMVVGINGVGKTTSIGKLAHQYVRAGRTVMIAAADTFRAAANEQIAVWAERSGAALIQQKHGADPASVAFDAVHAASSRGTDVIIIDTAGRLHTKINLMEELRKIKRVIQRHDPAAPHEVLLVIDASTGQNGLQQARQFGASVGVTGLILTKLDGTAKGGIVLAISREMNIPVKFIGTGEGMDDLQPFDRTAYVEALFAT